jgi:hypothetical protein
VKASQLLFQAAWRGRPFSFLPQAGSGPAPPVEKVVHFFSRKCAKAANDAHFRDLHPMCGTSQGSWIQMLSEGPRSPAEAGSAMRVEGAGSGSFAHNEGITAAAEKPYLKRLLEES